MFTSCLIVYNVTSILQFPGCLPLPYTTFHLLLTSFLLILCLPLVNPRCQSFLIAILRIIYLPYLSSLQLQTCYKIYFLYFLFNLLVTYITTALFTYCYLFMYLLYTIVAIYSRLNYCFQ